MTSEEIIEKVKTDQGEVIASSEVNLGDSVLFVSKEAIHGLRNISRTIPTWTLIIFPK